MKYERHFVRFSDWSALIVRCILVLLTVIIIGALLVGVGKAGYDLYRSLSLPLHQVLQIILLNTVFILALVELSKTVLGYIKDGSVEVRYIIDTILVIMLNELVTMWFAGDTSFSKAAGLCLIISMLFVMRFSHGLSQYVRKLLWRKPHSLGLPDKE